MGDIATVWRNGAGDWQVQGASLLADDGLQSAVVMSLFTDRLAGADDVLPSGQADSGRRGWWGDAYAAVQGDLIGSRLWLLAREKATPQVLRRAEEYAREALQWLVDDGAVRAIDVQAEWLAGREREGVMGLQVQLARSNEPAAQYRFEAFWKGA